VARDSEQRRNLGLHDFSHGVTRERIYRTEFRCAITRSLCTTWRIASPSC